MEEKELEIIVLNRDKASEFVTDRAYLHISVRDPGSEPVITPNNPNQVARLDLEFSDFDLGIFPKLADNPKIKAFSNDDAKSILEVLKITEKYINLIVINCEAGISRSAAIAAAISKLVGKSDSLYFSPKGPYYPNRFVYRKILNIAMDCRPIGE